MTHMTIPCSTIEYSFSSLSSKSYYIITGLCFSGSRHYSEIIFNFSNAQEIFEEYCGVVSYFGGGIVYLYCINNFDYEIVKSKKVY